MGTAALSYADRLLHLGFHSSEYRRVFLDLLMCFKIVKTLLILMHQPFSTSTFIIWYKRLSPLN